MPRAGTTSKKKKKTSAKKPGSTTGVMALARKAAKAAGNLPESEWRVSLDPNALIESLPHLPTGSLIIDFLIGGELNDKGVRPCPGLPRGRVAQIWGHESAGKCVPADTRVATPWGLLTVGEVFERQGLVASCTSRTTEMVFPLYNRHGKVENTTHFTHNNRKTTFTTRTSSGGQVRSTSNHPHLVMSPRGTWVWKETRNLQEGDYMVAARSVVPDGENLIQEDNDTAYMAGLILADGHLADNRIEVTNDDSSIKTFLTASGTKVLGVSPKTYPNGDSPESVLHHYNSKENVTAFYETWGWEPCNSPTKVVGPRIRSLANEPLTNALQGYFDCECSVDVEKTCIEVSSASRELLDDIKVLLQLRFGIVSLLREKKVKAYPDNTYWRMTLSGDEARSFIRQIGTRSVQRMGQYEALLCTPHEGGSTNHDSVPNLGGLLRDLYDSAETNRELNRLVADYMDPSPRAALTYDRLGKILEAFGDNGDPLLLRRLHEIQEAHYYYDRVESLEENEPEPTFDFAMSESASFNANGFVTHNTTLALTAAATTCANGGTVLYIDWENDIVPDYAAALGVPITDPDKFELAQPNTLEDGVKLAMMYAAAGVDLIVFDSIGAAVPARIANRELADVGEQSRVGELQAVWSQELPNLKRVISRKGGCILGISQIRAKISTGQARGGPTTQPQGGNAWKFYASVRLELRRIKQEKAKLFNVLTHKTDDRIQGGVINCKVVKCKLSSSQGREELFYIRFGEGIDDVRSVMEIGAAHGVIKKAGSWLSASLPSGEFKVQGTNGFLDHLKANPDDFTALYKAVIPLLGQRTFKEEELEDLDDVAMLLAEVAGPADDSDDDDGSDDGDEG